MFRRGALPLKARIVGELLAALLALACLDLTALEFAHAILYYRSIAELALRKIYLAYGGGVLGGLAHAYGDLHGADVKRR